MPLYDRLQYVQHYIGEGLWDGLPLQIVCDGTDAALRARLDELVAERPEIAIHHYPENRGVAAARGAGIAAVSTPYLAFCDDDDFIAQGGDFLDEVAALMDDETTLFAAMPEVHAFNESLRTGLQYDRREFHGVTGRELLRFLVATGEMRVLTLGAAFRPADLRGLEPEPFFKVSEDYTLLARLCARHPERRVRITDTGRYMRLIQAGSLSSRQSYSIEKIVMHLVSMCVGAFYLIECGELSLPAFRSVLSQRGDVLQNAYTRGSAAANAVAGLLAGQDPDTGTDEAARTVRFLEANRDGLPPEFLHLAGWGPAGLP